MKISILSETNYSLIFLYSNFDTTGLFFDDYLGDFSPPQKTESFYIAKFNRLVMVIKVS